MMAGESCKQVWSTDQQKQSQPDLLEDGTYLGDSNLTLSNTK